MEHNNLFNNGNNGNGMNGEDKEISEKKIEPISVEAVLHKKRKDMKIERAFSQENEDVFEFNHLGEKIAWEKTEVKITDDSGKVIYIQKDVEKPKSWSELATKVVASKYFWGNMQKNEREDSVKKLVSRISDFFERKAQELKYFDEKQSKILRDEIASICLNQLAVFNSPVWFNVGIQKYDKIAGGVSPYKWHDAQEKVLLSQKNEDRPQCSACFILGVEDNIESIMDLQKAEVMLFKGGSGAGENRSPLRSSKERLTGGGVSSGPLSFMKGYDSYAGAIKSGGKTRRAAKMEILNVDHPDIMDFINAKQNEEKKAWALIDAGFSGGLNGEAYSSVFFQNSNMSVRVTDEFIQAAKNDKEWNTKYILTGKICETLSAKEMLRKIAEGTWICGDPGIQCDSVINQYHTCKNSGRINASNPCFSGDVKVALIDGRNLTFKELVEEDKMGRQNFCYSVGKSGFIEKRKIVSPRLTRRNAEVIKVILDNGEEIVCTPNHKFMLKSKEYKEAKDLTVEDSLMPLYEKEIGITPIHNHKIKRIEFLKDKIDVYDIEVPDTHNFALASGVFVHNCSEYMFLDDTACNLASINLMKYRTIEGKFDYEIFRKVVRRMITAMEIIVDGASYPTEKITERSHKFRTLGLGYANLGALLMSLGLPYDSEEGRAVAAAITAIMCGEAYKTSAELAGLVGVFPEYEKNKEPMLEVIRMHREHVKDIDVEKIPFELRELVNVAWDCWTEALELGEKYGFRNAQVSVLAPTGCLVGNSLISTDKGLVRLTSLGNKNGEQWQDVSFNVMTDEGPRNAAKFYINGNDMTRKIKTSSGYEIQGTDKHKIKVLDSETHEWVWKKFLDVSEKDIVPLSMNTIFGEEKEMLLPPKPELHWNADFELKTPEKMNENLAQIIGYFMGDGSLHTKGLRFCVDNNDEDVIENLRKLIKETFNLNIKVSQRQGYKEVAVHSTPLVMWWDGCGFSKLKPSEEHKGKGYTPYIPDAVLHTNNRKIYSSFLKGLFEADGTVNLGVPSLSTSSQSFANEIRTLLLALGYPTRTKIDISGFGQSELYVIRLKNISYNKVFLENVGFMGSRKLSRMANRSLQSGKNDHIYLQDEVLEEIAPIGSQYRDAALLSLKRNQSISRDLAVKMYQDTKHPQLSWALQFFYDKIESNIDGGIQPTYDISVPENVTYTANGFISHNTIGFMMDCDTTGIEPDIALVKYKVLAGGGMLKIVNRSVILALRKLGYSEKQIKEIESYIDQNDTIEGSIIKDEHLPVFDCAFKAANGKRSINWKGHVDMMAVTQPFISGAISKTINMSESSSVEDITTAYVYAWEKGLKAVAIYRENSKRSQPLNTKKTKGEMWEKEKVKEIKLVGERRKLPQTRKSIIHKFEISGHEGYLTIGLYDDEKPGEIFITMHKQGSTIRGLMDAWATSVSLNLQYGASVNDLFSKFRHQKFEPAGFVKNLGGGAMDEKIRTINTASSIVDYVAQFMLNNFSASASKPEVKIENLQIEEKDEQAELGDFGNEGLTCPLCGGPAKRIGNCAIRCTSCNQTVRSGCGE